MIFLRDLIIRVSFKVSFPHLYFLEVWRSWMGLCYKRQYNFLLCASVVLSILSFPQKITPEIRSQPLLYSIL